MFQPVVSLLMLSSIAVHTVLGCCWHHTHPEHDSPCPTAETHGHIHIGEAGHGHDHGRQGAETGGQPLECPADPCCEEFTCSYMASPSAKLPLPVLEKLGGMPALVGTLVSPPGLLSPADGRLEEFSPQSGRSAVRDLTQVWLL